MRGNGLTDAHPDYIFETLPNDHILLDHHQYPDSYFNESISNITSRKVQFFVGPVLSGAPIHFHRYALCALALTWLSGVLGTACFMGKKDGFSIRRLKTFIQERTFTS